MNTLSVRMLGQLRICSNHTELVSLQTRKVQELFCYLLLNRQHPHPRETLASVFWSTTPTAQSRANLRKTLWHLQTALDDNAAGDLILADAESVQINQDAALWLDVAVLEKVFAQVRDSAGDDMSDDHAQVVRTAVALYQGDLLNGWYQDWCLFERERMQNMYLALLDKLMGYCEAHHQFTQGIAYGDELLRYDRTREQTYRRLMRLYVLAGDRTGALRQYERCVYTLTREFEIEPSEPTRMLYERIKANRPLDDAHPALPAQEMPSAVALNEVLSRMRGLQHTVASISQLIDHDIQFIEQMLHRHTSKRK